MDTDTSDGEYDERTFQEKLNDFPEVLKMHLENYVLIDPKYYKDIQPGSSIRYITDEGKFRFGGKVLVNGYPEFLVLHNYKYTSKWSINLEKSIIFLKDHDKVKKESVIKENLFRLYKEGYIEIKTQPHNDLKPDLDEIYKD